MGEREVAPPLPAPKAIPLPARARHAFFPPASANSTGCKPWEGDIDTSAISAVLHTGQNRLADTRPRITRRRFSFTDRAPAAYHNPGRTDWGTMYAGPYRPAQRANNLLPVFAQCRDAVFRTLFPNGPLRRQSCSLSACVPKWTTPTRCPFQFSWDAARHRCWGSPKTGDSPRRLLRPGGSPDPGPCRHRRLYCRLAAGRPQPRPTST